MEEYNNDEILNINDYENNKFYPKNSNHNAHLHLADTTLETTCLQQLICTIAAAVFNCLAHRIFKLLPTSAANYLHRGITISTGSNLLAFGLGASIYVVSRIFLTCFLDEHSSLLKREFIDLLITSIAGAALNLIFTLLFAETQILFIPTLIAGATIGAGIYLVNKIALSLLYFSQQYIFTKNEKIPEKEIHTNIDQKILPPTNQNPLFSSEIINQEDQIDVNNIHEEINEIPFIKSEEKVIQKSFFLENIDQIKQMIKHENTKIEQHHTFVFEMGSRKKNNKECGFYYSKKEMLILEKKQNIYKLRMYKILGKLGNGKYGTVSMVQRYVKKSEEIAIEGKKYALKTPFLLQKSPIFQMKESSENKEWVISQKTIKNEMIIAISLRGNYKKYLADPSYRKEIRQIKLVGIQELPHHVHCGIGEGLLMALCDGSLLDFADKHPLRFNHFCAMISQLLEGLAHIHKKKIVHGDICKTSPMNILFRQEGEDFLFFLSDFGFAKNNATTSEIETDIVGLSSKFFIYLLGVKTDKLSGLSDHPSVASLLSINEELSLDLKYYEHHINTVINFFEKENEIYKQYSIVINFLNEMMSKKFSNGTECLERWNLIKEKL